MCVCVACPVGARQPQAVRSAAADNARQIVEEAQKRTDAKSQRYEGLLQVFDAKGKIIGQALDVRAARLARRQQGRCCASPRRPRSRASRCSIVNHPDRASDQWMWTPAIERDRRIALQDRSTRFFGTDFSFEDLEERDVEPVRLHACSATTRSTARACWKIQSTPQAGEVVAVHAVDRLDSQGQLRVRADRELRQGRRSCGA